MSHPDTQSPVVCTCFQIDQDQVATAISHGHDDFKKLRKVLGVAGDCGNCHRAIKVLLKAHQKTQDDTDKAPLRRRFPMPWKHMSAKKLAQEYSPSSVVKDIMVYINDYIVFSKSAKAKLSYQANLKYKDIDGLELGSFDYFYTDTQDKAPLVIYLHGGYWQELSKNESCFMAPGIVSQGINIAVVDYTLAPKASLEEIIAQCCHSVADIVRQHKELGFDASKVIIAGSSAGAHLCATVMQAAQNSLYGLLPDSVDGAILLSGVYDLRPIVETYINEPLGLDLQSAQKLSPGLFSNQGMPPCVIAYGSQETQEFKRQSLEYHKQLLSDAVRSECMEIEARNHFDVVFELGDSRSKLQQHLMQLIANLNSKS